MYFVLYWQQQDKHTSKSNQYGLMGRPTYQDIIGLPDEHAKKGNTSSKQGCDLLP